MLEKSLSSRQIMSIIILFLSGSSIAASGNFTAQQNLWISVLISGIILLLLSVIYLYPATKYPESDFFKINEIAFGTFFGKSFNIVYLACGLLTCALNLSLLTSFIKTISLKLSSSLTISLFIIIVCACFSASGVVSKGKFSEIALYFVVAMILFSIIICMPYMDFLNLKPVISDLSPTFEGAFQIFVISFSEVFFAIAFITGYLPKDKKTKVFRGVFYGTILIVFIFIRNIAVLGSLVTDAYFPSYLAVSIVSLGEFFERQEVFVSIVFLLCDVLKISVIINFAKRGLDNIVEKKTPNALLICICGLILIISLVLNSHNTKIFEIVSYYKHFLILPIIILPTFCGVVCLFKKR